MCDTDKNKDTSAQDWDEVLDPEYRGEDKETHKAERKEARRKRKDEKTTHPIKTEALNKFFGDKEEDEEEA